jgi:2-amino-4-hydroxy-6-hydroxymethyldihydropteridine diphosphokinase
MSAALIGLGSNVGDRQAILDWAVKRLAEHPSISVRATSQWRQTSPIGGPSGQGEFLNGAVLLETSLAATELFVVLQSTEKKAGRERTAVWGPRTLDLDLLLFDDAVMQSADLTVPHPRMAFRRFVIDPAAEIAPDWVHPVLLWSLGRLRDHLHIATPYVALAGPRSPHKSQLAYAAAARVGGVYLADPAGIIPSASPSLLDEIQFLELRARQISRANWPHGATPAISDYWIEQPVDESRSDEELVEFQRRLDRLSEDMTRPKLLVICDRPWNGGTPPAPLLEIPASNLPAALSELTAAIRAMESPS